jgi:hypothetical protein
MSWTSLDTAAATSTEKLFFLGKGSNKFMVIPIVESVYTFGSEIMMILNFGKILGET